MKLTAIYLYVGQAWSLKDLFDSNNRTIYGCRLWVNLTFKSLFLFLQSHFNPIYLLAYVLEKSTKLTGNHIFSNSFVLIKTETSQRRKPSLINPWWGFKTLQHSQLTGRRFITEATFKQQCRFYEGLYETFMSPAVWVFMLIYNSVYLSQQASTIIHLSCETQTQEIHFNH